MTWSFAVREFRYWLTNYRRTWRGSIYTSVLSPVLYLGAMGLGLGTLVDAHTWPSWRPACWPPPPCRPPSRNPRTRCSAR